MAVAGLALATSISIYVSCILLLVLLRRKIGALGILGWVKDVARIGLASICILLSAVGSKSVLSGMPPIILVGVAAIVGLLLYVVVLWLLKQQEVREAADKVMSYLRRRNK
jgi:putative peptidoglycan lipid II flippase